MLQRVGADDIQNRLNHHAAAKADKRPQQGSDTHHYAIKQCYHKNHPMIINFNRFHKNRKA